MQKPSFRARLQLFLLLRCSPWPHAASELHKSTAHGVIKVISPSAAAALNQMKPRVNPQSLLLQVSLCSFRCWQIKLSFTLRGFSNLACIQAHLCGMQQGSHFKPINHQPTVGAAEFRHCAAHVAHHSVPSLLSTTSVLLLCGRVIYFNAKN